MSVRLRFTSGTGASYMRFPAIVTCNKWALLYVTSVGQKVGICREFYSVSVSCIAVRCICRDIRHHSKTAYMQGKRAPVTLPRTVAPGRSSLTYGRRLCPVC